MNLQAYNLLQLYAFTLILARLAGVIGTAPFLSNRAIPATIKAALAVVLSLAVTPLTMAKMGAMPTNVFILGGQVIGEAVFGMALGYCARLLFSAVEMAGYLIDTQMGFGFVNLVNPFSEQQASIMSGLQYQLAITLYILMNGHLLLLGSMVRSLNALPPGSISLHSGFGLALLPMLKLMFTLGFRLALPAVGVLLTMDLAFGLIARLVPQVNVFMVGIPAKVIVGVATMALLLPTVSLIVGQFIVGTASGLDALIAGAK